MQSLKITQRGLDWLTQTESFRVLHQFENVCNLINQSNQILAIHTADIGMGPFSCQIERSRFQQIISADSIKLGPANATFSIGNHSFSTKDCALWNARPNWISFDYSTAVDIEHQLSDGVQERTRALHQAILANDQTTLKNEVGQLAGRGIGLTPEGDDVLLGTFMRYTF